MFKRKTKEDDRFDVIVNVAIFTYSDGVKLALLRDGKGKYFLPNKKLKKGEACEELAENIIDSSCSTSESSPYIKKNCGLLSQPDRYENHKHDISIVFRADFALTTSFGKEFMFFRPEEVSKIYTNHEFIIDHGDIVRTAING